MRKSLTFFTLFILLLSSGFSTHRTKKTKAWVHRLSKQVRAMESDFQGEFGVYVEDLESGDSFSYKADQFWYLSSTTKVPVAIALLQLVDQKKLSLAEKVAVKKEDYRDGAGPVNWIEPGNKASYHYLLKQMLIYSDNAATDLIIKRIGLDAVNSVVQKWALKKEFGPITTLLDVRRKAYGEMHPKARDLPAESFFAIKKKRGSKNRARQLAAELKLPKNTFNARDLDEAFDRYYKAQWNSATLLSYAELLRNLLNQKILSEESTKLLIKTMTGIQTGKKRIRKGLSRRITWSHKTGTQHRQACDIGFARHSSAQKAQALILVCTRQWKKLSEAEALMAKLGKALSKTNLFKEPAEPKK